ncbi:MAG: hypothetical protein CMF22_11980 [Idiomarinaceae bacterium]|nr:hypothetical protein [Idiomarinaceae bacterium]|tara:strand:+ start:16598 stop:18316 length:1719 start_codon:yes stop_codon:yes gene_type:complete
MYISATESKGEIHVWERDQNGLHHHIHPAENYTYLFMRDNTGTGEFKDLYGNPMKKVPFKDRRTLQEFARNRQDIVAESDVPLTYRFLLDEYSDTEVNSPYHVAYYDIETDFDLSEGLGYPVPEKPHGEINSFSVFDSAKKEYTMIFRHHLEDEVGVLEDDEYPVNILYAKSEWEMLHLFREVIEDSDILAAWNGDGYDLPYIIERLKVYMPEKEAASFLCRGGFPAKRRDFVDDMGNETWEWTLHGRCHLDMMKLFKKFHPSEQMSFALASICEEFLGESKIEFEDDLGSLYRENPRKFFEYSLHDSRLLMWLDRKMEVIKLAMMLARNHCVLPSDVCGSIKTIENGFIKFCRANGNIVLPDKQSPDKESFDGAVVYDTLSGRFGYQSTIDLTALYPSCMMLLGLSTETYIYQLANRYEDYIAVMSDSDEMVEIYDVNTNERLMAKAADIHQMIIDDGLCISANGSIFNGEMGLLSAYVKETFEMRKHYKKLMKTAETQTEREQHDLFQKVLKIVCNSLYGAISNQFFRLFNIELARSITGTARCISKFQATMANDLVDELVDMKERGELY